jgi:hypothetical protein
MDEGIVLTDYPEVRLRVQAMPARRPPGLQEPRELAIPQLRNTTRLSVKKEELVAAFRGLGEGQQDETVGLVNGLRGKRD